VTSLKLSRLMTCKQGDNQGFHLQGFFPPARKYCWNMQEKVFIVLYIVLARNMQEKVFYTDMERKKFKN
jgi:hypothetical protein